jgi:hypothetical protein
MASLARIPFTPEQEGTISTLAGWMLFVLVVHFIAGGLALIGSCLGVFGAVASFSLSPVYGALQVVQMLLVLGLAVALLVQGVLLVQARGALSSVVQTDTSDQEHLSVAFKRLKVFFLVEVGFTGINLLMALVSLGMTFAMPEIPDLGGGFGPGGGFGGGGGYNDPYGGGSW